MKVRLGCSVQPKQGEMVGGDAVLIEADAQRTLVAVIDGLGHGPQAAAASAAASEFIPAHKELGLAELFARCHRTIASTQGVAMAIVTLDHETGTLCHAGVGNVDLSFAGRERYRPVCQPGIIGCRFRRVIESTHATSPGDTIVLHSDGVSSRFSLEDYPTRVPTSLRLAKTTSPKGSILRSHLCHPRSGEAWGPASVPPGVWRTRSTWRTRPKAGGGSWRASREALPAGVTGHSLVGAVDSRALITLISTPAPR